MGMCCVVFDIDGMFEFFMNFVVNKKSFMFSPHLMLFPTFLEKKLQGGGGIKTFFFKGKHFFLIIFSCFLSVLC